MPTIIIGNNTPFELFYNGTPQVDTLKVFGCICYVHVLSQVKQNLDEKAIKCIFLGIDVVKNGYRCLNVVHDKFYISTGVKFDEMQTRKTLECDVQISLSSKVRDMDQESDVDDAKETNNEKIDYYAKEVDINRGTTSQLRRPWMDGKFNANGLLYDEKWGGLTSRNGSKNSGVDSGFGLYNDHHIHLRYFVYARAVLMKLDPQWGMEYMAHLYTMVEDYMSFHHYNHHVCVLDHDHDHDHDQHTHHEHTMVSRSEPLFPRFRNFDFWVLHSWAAGLTEFADGRNQENSCEAVNAYYSAALLGLAFRDKNLVNAGFTLMAFEIRAARALWHIPSDSTLYEQSFVSTHRMVGVLWANKRDTGLWFTPSEWKERRLGIQVLPILPITEILFRDVRFVIELVKWARPSLRRPGVGDGWKGFVYALQALYAPEEALKNVKALSGHDDGNSLSNMLWWIYSRWPCGQGG